MPIRQYKPTSPGRRNASGHTFEELTKKAPEKSLTVYLEKKGRAGRNANGRITIRHRGGGHKRLYRIIDFKRALRGVDGKVVAIEYDPNGSAMTPRDHPHGGGEGKAPIGLAGPKTPWGKPAYGVKTRKHKKASDRLI